MSQGYLTNKSFVQEVGVKLYICNIVARKIYNNKLYRTFITIVYLLYYIKAIQFCTKSIYEFRVTEILI